MREDAAFRSEQNLFKIGGGEGLASHAHGEASDEFRLHPVVDDVARLRQPQVIAVVLDPIRRPGSGRGESRTEAKRAALHAAFDLVGQFVERAADDEEDVPCIDGSATRPSRALQFHHRLHLRRDVILPLEVHIGFLHQFEQVDLDSASGNIAASGGAGSGRDLIDFVDVDDAELRKLDITVGRFGQIPNEVLNVAPDIPRFREFCGVRLDKRHPNQACNTAHQVSFSDTRRTQKKDVLFGVIALAQIGVFQALPDVVIMIANRYR